MATFVMLGTYSAEAIENISSKRTKQAEDIIEEHGGKLQSIYILLGEYDIHVVAEFPDMQHAMKASIALTKATDISFSTSEAFTAEEFDALMS
ncbi:MAG: GYD domain-containing protein [Melioribacteraceae bacterium]|nr:GYD domain-containing protein [Melioribacteraceae bacterium]